MTSARDEILARISSALRPRPVVADIPRTYRRTGAHAAGSPELLDLLTDRLVDYKATVHRTTAADLPGTLSSTLDGTGRLLVPAGLPDGWAPSGTVDSSFTPSELEVVQRFLLAMTEVVVAARRGD